jgi:DHA1 family bicyclomycin/chloramphenicol resistance-like MFS transporter
MGYINSIQQIVFDVFRRPELIAATFAGVALPMAFTSWLNSRIVERIGTRRVAHAGLALFTLSALVHLGIVLTTGESLWLFIAMQGVTMACFGLASANFGALAMQPLGHVAGTASSVQGTVGTLGGALLGLLVGQSFDGTLVPMVGSFAAFGAIGLLILLATERGRLFGRG